MKTTNTYVSIVPYQGNQIGALTRLINQKLQTDDFIKGCEILINIPEGGCGFSLKELHRTVSEITPSVILMFDMIGIKREIYDGIGYAF